MDMKNCVPRGLSAPCPSTCLMTICSNFFSETPWPIKAKFYRKRLWEWGTNVFINNLGHMSKMATAPIYGKNL